MRLSCESIEFIQTLVLRYSEPDNFLALWPGSSEYLRTGVDCLLTDINPWIDECVSQIDKQIQA